MHLRFPLALLIASCVLRVSAPPHETSLAAADRPNIVLIYADDRY
jgi:hypothetical protein